MSTTKRKIFLEQKEKKPERKSKAQTKLDFAGQITSGQKGERKEGKMTAASSLEEKLDEMLYKMNEDIEGMKNKLEEVVEYTTKLERKLNKMDKSWKKEAGKLIVT